jgi:integrase
MLFPAFRQPSRPCHSRHRPRLHQDGFVASTEPVDLARIALRRLGLVGKGDERDRRPTQDELDQIITAFENNHRQQIPVGRIARFAVATAMRLDEISKIQWRDYDSEKKMLLIRDRKDPRKKKGNDQRIPLLDISGYDACGIIGEQPSAGFGHSSGSRFGSTCVSERALHAKLRNTLHRALAYPAGSVQSPLRYF